MTPDAPRPTPAARIKLLIGTRSDGKVREIQELFVGLPYQVVFPPDLGLERLPDERDLEQGTSYAENAVAKARYFAGRSGLPTCADDSGLEVDALGGVPGVYSARFAGLFGGPGGPPGAELSPDARNNALLVEKLAGVGEGRRTARYRCVLAYLRTATAVPELVEAACEGYIVLEPRGTGGFGYDPLFYSTELQMTFAQASPAAKQRVSHRGRAFRALIEVLLRRTA